MEHERAFLSWNFANECVCILSMRINWHWFQCFRTVAPGYGTNYHDVFLYRHNPKVLKRDNSKLIHCVGTTRDIIHFCRMGGAILLCGNQCRENFSGISSIRRGSVYEIDGSVGIVSDLYDRLLIVVSCGMNHQVATFLSDQLQALNSHFFYGAIGENFSSDQLLTRIHCISFARSSLFFMSENK